MMLPEDYDVYIITTNCPHIFLREQIRTRTGASSSSSSTTNTDSKLRKGLDEQDGAFGRLFGILALCQSGILNQALLEVSLHIFYSNHSYWQFLPSISNKFYHSVPNAHFLFLFFFVSCYHVLNHTQIIHDYMRDIL